LVASALVLVVITAMQNHGMKDIKDAFGEKAG
jgi:hypothetical protein